MRLLLVATAFSLLALPSRAGDTGPLVDVATACPGIQIELRYATARNVTGKPIYPQNARALVLPSLAAKLNRAHRTLHARGYGLKIWDAYRPIWVQRLLWERVRDRAFVVEPTGIGSLHAWGAAVDVTLVDFGGREVRMPTDFDAFTTAARYDYTGKDPEIAANLKALKHAMAEAGFRHIRDEWWHYSSPDKLEGRPPEVSLEPRGSAKDVPPPVAKPPPKSLKTSP